MLKIHRVFHFLHVFPATEHSRVKILTMNKVSSALLEGTANRFKNLNLYSFLAQQVLPLRGFEDRLL